MPHRLRHAHAALQQPRSEPDRFEGQPLRLGELSGAEALFLRSFRGWSQGRECWCEVWNEHAKRFGAADGRLLLHLFCDSYGAVREAALRPILHHPPCCLYLAPDEARLTGMFSALALQRPDTAHFAGRLLLESKGISRVHAAMTKLAGAYAARGLAVAGSSPLIAYAQEVAGTA